MNAKNPQEDKIVPLNIDALSFDSFDRTSLDIVCVSPIRTIVRREEEILILRRVRKVEEIDAGLVCPTNSVPISSNGDDQRQEDKPKKDPTPPEPSLRVGTVYVQDYVKNQTSNLYSLDLTTGKATLIGAIATEVYDLAFVGAKLYGLDKKDGKKAMQLIEINPKTGTSTVIGDVGYEVFGLAYNRQRQTLYASAAQELIAIDTKTGEGKPAVTVGNKDRYCGEVAFDANGKAYITLLTYDNDNLVKLLATCDLDSGNVTTIGNIGFPDLTSMKFYNGLLYGVTGNYEKLGRDGLLLTIDTHSGSGTIMHNTDPVRCWAGLTIYEG